MKTAPGDVPGQGNFTPGLRVSHAFFQRINLGFSAKGINGVGIDLSGERSRKPGLWRTNLSHTDDGERHVFEYSRECLSSF
ncbi:MAG: hypothetical protein ACOY90_09710 [Candidatus Zhuqueibacterota bacterium]